jgi:hypothetical protein
MKQVKTIVLTLILFLSLSACAQSVTVNNRGTVETYNVQEEKKGTHPTNHQPLVAVIVGAVAIFFLAAGYYEFKKKGHKLNKFK